MTREELQYQLDIVIYESQQAEPCYYYEDKVEAEQKILAHDQAQREEIARLNNLLCSVDKDHAVEKLNKEIARLREILALRSTSGSWDS